MKNFAFLSLSLLLGMSGIFFRTINTKEVKSKMTKVAYVDYQQLMALDKKNLTKAVDEWQDEISEVEQELKPLDQSLQNLDKKYADGITEIQSMRKSELTSQAAMQRKAQEVGQLEYQLRQKMQEREAVLNKKLSEARAKVKPKIDKVIDEVRQEQNWDIIFKVAQDAVSAKSEFNLTDTVRNKVNGNYSSELKAKAEAKAKEKPEASVKSESKAKETVAAL